jgi:hypothetical protein
MGKDISNMAESSEKQRQHDHESNMKDLAQLQRSFEKVRSVLYNAPTRDTLSQEFREAMCECENGLYNIAGLLRLIRNRDLYGNRIK